MAEENKNLEQEQLSQDEEEKVSENGEVSTDAEKPVNTGTVEEEKEDKLPEQSELDKLKEENFRLKVQMTARDIGFKSEVIEDAVVLAENIVKRDGVEIEKALQTVAKKYPEWSMESNKKNLGNFKVGADKSATNSGTQDKLKIIF